jgi:hypothetical protein
MRGGWCGAVALAVLAGCSGAAGEPGLAGSGLSRRRDAAVTEDETAAAVDRVASHLDVRADPNGPQFSAEESVCVAERVVSDLGVARPVELGLHGDGGDPPFLREPPLDGHEADLVFAAITACVDMRGQVIGLFASGGASTPAAACMADRYLASELPRRALMADVTDDALSFEIEAMLLTISVACDEGLGVPRPTTGPTAATLPGPGRAIR